MVAKSGDAQDVLFTIRLTPGADRNELGTFADGTLAVKVTARPLDNAANEACCALLAKVLHVPKSDVIVLRGAKSRVKQIQVRSYAGELPWR